MEVFEGNPFIFSWVVGDVFSVLWVVVSHENVILWVVDILCVAALRGLFEQLQ